MNYIMGGHLKEIPKPHIRVWDKPGRKKRRVEVNITVFYGIGHHYHVNIREEENPILCSCADAEKVHHHKTWDDKDADGKTFDDKFNTEKEARNWVRKIFKKNFSRTTHELVSGLGNDKLKWFYKDGD